MKELKFFKCNLCGNIVELVHSGGGKLVCCGQPMNELVANTTDAAQEKHVPVIIKDGNKVTVEVGSVIHPMTDEHYIMWIVLVAGEQIYRKHLQPGEKPEMTVTLEEDADLTAYEYCNLHGLWKASK